MGNNILKILRKTKSRSSKIAPDLSEVAIFRLKQPTYKVLTSTINSIKLNDLTNLNIEFILKRQVNAYDDYKEIEFLMESTQFSKDEIVEYYNQFKKVAPHGELNRKEFIEFFAKLRPDKNANMLCDQFFNAFDSNKNGMVDFHEFLVAISLTSNRDPRSKLKFAFRMYDTNHDKKLSAEEIEKIIIGIYEFNGQKSRDGRNDPKNLARSMLQKHDKDKNGHLTEDEFVEGILTQSTLFAIESFSVLRNATKPVNSNNTTSQN